MTFRAASAVLLLAVTGWVATAPAAGAPHHRVHIELAPETGRLEATDHITTDGRMPVSFALAPGLKVVSVLADESPVEATRKADRWLIEAPTAVKELVISYAGDLPTAPGETPFLGPDGGFLAANAGWLPSLGSGPVTFDLTVETPKPYVAVATGDLSEEASTDGTYRARFVSGRAGETPSLFVGPYAVQELEANGIRIRTYLYPDQADLAPVYLDRTSNYLKEFAERIGEYPYDDFRVVAAPVPVGLGFPGLTYVARQILPLPYMQARSLAHEILHSWWGNAVAVDYARGNWAEGLTTYMADHEVVAQGDPALGRAMRLEWLRDFAALPEERDAPLASFVSKRHDAAQVIGYNKAAFLFHMLRQTGGDAAFSAAIQDFWQSHRFQMASWDDLQAAFERSFDQDLSAFFDQWLGRSGAPRLEIESADTRTVDASHELSLEIAQADLPYGLQVPIEIETARGLERVVGEIDGPRTKLTFTMDDRPLTITIDPDYDVFRHLAAGEAPPILRDVTLGAVVPALIPSTAPEWNGIASELAERMIDGRVETVSETDPRTAGLPLLVIGMSSEIEGILARLDLPPTPDLLVGRGDARAWTTRRADGNAVLIVEAEGADALRTLLRPLPHYGRRSYVVFEDGEVIDKGVWPAGDNPLRKVIG